jgi:hypothetical protein
MASAWFRYSKEEYHPGDPSKTFFNVRFNATHDEGDPHGSWIVNVEIYLGHTDADLSGFNVKTTREFYYEIVIDGRVVDPGELPKWRLEDILAPVIREQLIEPIKLELTAKLTGEDGAKRQREIEEAAQAFADVRQRLQEVTA